MERLRQLHDAGVSIWLDTLSRGLLTSGEFQTLLDEWSVTGHIHPDDLRHRRPGCRYL